MPLLNVDFLRNASYFLLINPWNHSGKLPLWRIRGAWVSVNHLRASSLSLLSVLSWTSPPGWLWSILTRSCVNIERQMRQRHQLWHCRSTPTVSFAYFPSDIIKRPRLFQQSHCSCLSCQSRVSSAWLHFTAPGTFFKVSETAWGHVNFLWIFCIDTSALANSLLL